MRNAGFCVVSEAIPGFGASPPADAGYKILKENGGGRRGELAARLSFVLSPFHQVLLLAYLTPEKWGSKST